MMWNYPANRRNCGVLPLSSSSPSGSSGSAHAYGALPHSEPLQPLLQPLSPIGNLGGPDGSSLLWATTNSDTAHAAWMKTVVKMYTQTRKMSGWEAAEAEWMRVALGLLPSVGYHRSSVDMTAPSPTGSSSADSQGDDDSNDGEEQVSEGMKSAAGDSTSEKTSQRSTGRIATAVRTVSSSTSGSGMSGDARPLLDQLLLDIRASTAAVPSVRRVGSNITNDSVGKAPKDGGGNDRTGSSRPAATAKEGGGSGGDPAGEESKRATLTSPTTTSNAPMIPPSPSPSWRCWTVPTTVYFPCPVATAETYLQRLHSWMPAACCRLVPMVAVAHSLQVDAAIGVNRTVVSFLRQIPEADRRKRPDPREPFAFVPDSELVVFAYDQMIVAGHNIQAASPMDSSSSPSRWAGGAASGVLGVGSPAAAPRSMNGKLFNGIGMVVGGGGGSGGGTTLSDGPSVGKGRGSGSPLAYRGRHHGNHLTVPHRAGPPPPHFLDWPEYEQRKATILVPEISKADPSVETSFLGWAVCCDLYRAAMAHRWEEEGAEGCCDLP